MKKQIRFRNPAALMGGILSLAAFGASAQQFSIAWHRVANGGATSIGGAYRVLGTIGQAEAGALTSGAGGAVSRGVLSTAGAPAAHTAFQLTAGFGAIVLQQPGAPMLGLASAPGGGLFTWTTTAPGYTLQQGTSLDPSGTWTDVDAPVVTNGSRYEIAVPMPSGARTMFYRLRK